MLKRWTSLGGMCFIFLACQHQPHKENYSLPALDGNSVNVIVEIPAGTNTKIEYNPVNGVFVPDTLMGKTRVIEFLPYPGNYGFVPSTMMSEAKGGDGDALDILVIGQSMPTGTVLKAKLIGALLLKDAGELDTKLIAIPMDENARTLKADNFLSLLLDYDPAKRIIEEWFLNYKGKGVMELIRWEDEKYALQEIKKWSKTKE